MIFTKIFIRILLGDWGPRRSWGVLGRPRNALLAQPTWLGWLGLAWLDFDPILVGFGFDLVWEA